MLRTVRKITHAQGMGATGLSKLMELNAFNAGGEAAMAIGLAGTMFFAVPTGEARGRVALTLLVTMLPFVVLAPLIGPFLDRFAHARRWAMGSTLAIRAFFCWLLADAVVSSSIWLYPLALGCLVAGRAHAIARASAVPRMLPDGMQTVTANSRLYLAGLIGTGIAGALGGAAALAGAQWALRFAFVVFVIGTIFAIRLPPRTDSERGQRAPGLSRLGGLRHGASRNRPGLPTEVVLALRGNVAFRGLTGFLIIFMAFLLREQPLQGVPLGLQVGAVAAAAGVGNLTGTMLGALFRGPELADPDGADGDGTNRDGQQRPQRVIRTLLVLGIVVTALAAVLYGLVAIAAVGLVAGFAQQLGKLSLDASIQNQVPESRRNSVFARSETVIQLSWVLGGIVGIVMPLIPPLALATCALGLLGALLATLRAGRRT